MQGVHLRKYGVETTIDFELYETDGVDFKVDAAHASGDTTIMKDEGTEASTTNGFVDEGKGYSITLTATEMEAARIVVYIVDQGTKAWLDKCVVIETYGHASAMHAVDLDDSVRAGLTALPNAAADAAGGLPISDAGGLDLDALNEYVTPSSHTHHVAKTGNDSNGGHSFADALLTIGQAVTNAASGDMIIIHPGTYSEQVDLDTANKKLYLIGTNKDVCVILQTTATAVIAETGCEFENLTIMSTSSTHVGLQIDTKDNVRVTNCIVSGVQDGLAGHDSTNLRITDCYVFGGFDGINSHNNEGTIIERCHVLTDGSVTGYRAAAIVSSGSTGLAGLIIKDCVLKASRTASSSQPAAAIETNSKGVIVDNCVLIAKTSSSATGDCYGIRTTLDYSMVALVTAKNCNIRTDSNGGSDYDLYSDTGCQIDVANTSYDTSKTGGAGTINVAALIGSEMALEDDAIKSAKFDESTAFPIKSADTGSTEIARTGADGDTLETLSDEIAAVDTVVDAIQAKTDNLPADPASETNVDANETKIDTIDTVVDAIKTVTDNLPNSGALTDIDTGVNNIEAKLPSKSYLAGSADADGGIDSTEAAVINAEVDTALSDIHLDHLLAADYDPASKPGVATALLNELVESDGGVSRFTANALEEGPAGATSPLLMYNGTINVTDQTHLVLQSADSPDDDAYNNMIALLIDQSTGEQMSVRTISDYDQGTDTITLDSAPDFTVANGDTVKIIAVAPGSTPPTAAAIADAVWDEASSGHTDAGKAGEQLWTDVDAVKAKTDNLPASPAAVGSEMALEDDAITSAKFDESTAFPVASADSGSTQIARTGADGDTLETLSDEIDAVPTAAEIQAEMEENGASVLDTISDKLPTNYIMGSSVQTDKDDEIDAINRQMYVVIQQAIGARPDQTESLIHLLSASRHIERIADHATNIAEDVIYMVEGTIVRHKAEDYKPQIRSS